ncbi:peptidase M3A and M3B domain-containing protein [Cavenderia fasciculata]|uniref:Peptidase M3A and M3B domain-containing protein n=1 Tax=Cavenderia fasciculata TaxID=261658 RepID=F4PPF3_CACFS|nr:peptidase M3A and M3B domain-containing protein [Cavenderia fasciculata]EGG22266.1 peptidase M3A and M3B domain-containing protein [Cavenderia fasciculata]|eukprot:XP_004360117.1 peptidase M3A and M3B domain-containing protein [Cavenderia fasciculata]
MLTFNRVLFKTNNSKLLNSISSSISCILNNHNNTIKYTYQQQQVKSSSSSSPSFKYSTSSSLSSSVYNSSRYFSNSSVTRNNNKMTIPSAEKIQKDINLRFPSKVEDFAPRIAKMIKDHEQGISELIAIAKDKRTFVNTIEKLEFLNLDFANEENAITFVSNVSAVKEIRDASNAAESELNKYSIKTYMREDLYNAITEYVQVNPDYQTKLVPQQARLVKKTLEDFEKNGLQLPKEKRDRLKEIKEKISDNGIAYSQHIAEDKTTVAFTKDELKGVPEDILEGFQKEEGTGKYLATLKYPDLVPIVKYCQVTETRKKMDYLNGRKCIDTNLEILQNTLKLRFEAAQLRGQPDWASTVTQYYMAKNATNVRNFISRMTDLLKPHGVEELKRLQELKKSDYESRGEPLLEPEIKSYDYQYYNNLMLVKDFQVDNNLVKEYFPLELVSKELFNVYQELLDVTFEEVKEIPIQVWHPEVKMYLVRDNQNKDVVKGYFFLDLYPREGKFSHFAVWPLQPGFKLDDSHSSLPVAAMVCNFTKSTPSQPSLLTHDEVVTYFHEFGHVMHNMSSEVMYPRFSGTSVERDAVEMPSQEFELWCWDSNILNRISGHYKDGSKLPTDLVQRMLDSKNLNISLFYLRQLLFSSFDQKIHSNETECFDKLSEVWRHYAKNVALIENQPNTNPAANFGHLFGYDASYYSYMWSEVFSADIFSVFEKNGIMNKELGRKFRTQVLAVGGSQDTSITLKNFLGRDPEEAPFLKSLGLTK